MNEQQIYLCPSMEIEMKGRLAALVAEQVFPEIHHDSLGKGPTRPNGRSDGRSSLAAVNWNIRRSGAR
ncbi:hypothetical protein ACFKHW_04205 [Bradyrhizobium lupini]|uniref:hypothetical protein n=1 Tax=Rhizobium lupini TaxID=136996 RepID=UPI003670977D